MTKDELFQFELTFIQETNPDYEWPKWAHYIYVKRGREGGKIFRGNPTSVYDKGGAHELYKYDSTEQLLEDGWHVD